MELSPANARPWLASQGISTDNATFRSLGGGVSNQVILAETNSGRFVLKQSIGQLRVKDEWLADRDRIFREAAAMRWLSGKVDGGRVPAVVAEDRENFIIAMEAAPEAAQMWKTSLFSGELSIADASAAGAILASIIDASWNNADAQEIFGDQTVFDQLRIDAYYRTTAARCPRQADYIRNLMADSSARRLSLVHGDWTPKNLMTDGREMWAIDWEVVHFGDPAFDVGSLLNHLLLKSIALPDRRADFANLAEAFLSAFRNSWIVAAARDHLPALLLARVDGKSPAEYLDNEMKVTARRLAVKAMERRWSHPLEAFEQ